MVLLAPGWSNELLGLNDPTLFVWANEKGFSGAAWSRIPTVNYQLADRTEPPQLLALPAGEPGTALQRLAQTNPAAHLQTTDKLEPRASPAELLPPTTSLTARSSLRVEGELAARQLLSVPELPVRTNADLLASSVVQLMVDGDGQTISAALLAGSGDREADRYALDLAKHARFNSLRVSGPDRLLEKAAPVTWGKLVFDWHTMPMPPTNAPPAP